MTRTERTARSPQRGASARRTGPAPVVVPVRVAVRSLLWGPPGLALLGLLGWVLAGRPVGLGLVAGGGLALLLLVSGTLVVAVAARVDPRLSLLVAVTTFALHAVLAGVVLAAATGPAEVAEVLSLRALGIGLLGVAACWTLVQVLAMTRARIPVYDLPARGEDAVSRPEEAGAP